MRKLTVAIAGIFMALVVLRPEAWGAASESYEWVVDTDATACALFTIAQKTTIQSAVDSASPGDRIFVCDGTYNESVVIDTGILSLIGPGSTPEDDGTALVKHVQGDTAHTNFSITADSVSVSGFEINALGVASTSGATTGIWSFDGGTTVADNVIYGATGGGNIRGGNAGPSVIGMTVRENQLGSPYGILCYCAFSVFENNSDLGTFSILGDNNTVTGNTVTGAIAGVSSDSGIVTGNTFDAGGVQNLALQLAGNNLQANDNTIANATEYGLSVRADTFSTDGLTTVTLKNNAFTGSGGGIRIEDSAPDALSVAVTVNGGDPADANTFGPVPGLLVELLTAGNDFNAENNEWGLCTLEEIEAKIRHNPDDNTLGVVDYDPFVAPSECPTPTPVPTETPVVTATPTPTVPPQSLKFADLDCSGSVTPFDARGALFFAASLNNFESPVTCPAVGDDVTMSVAGGTPLKWGDIDCSGAVNAIDGLDLLAGLIGLAYDKGPNCPAIMDTVTISN
jgi:hypothetical protein